MIGIVVYVFGRKYIAGIFGGSSDGAYKTVKQWADKKEVEYQGAKKSQKKKHDKKVKEIDRSTTQEIAQYFNSIVGG